jgi:hypothetical protein
MSAWVQWLLAVASSGILLQEAPNEPVHLESGKVGSTEPSARTVDWKEGVAISVRVPVATPAREFMTTLVFPEETIETAITGWGEGDITAVHKRGLLFLRLMRKSEGQLNVIGGSGTHYLLTLRGVGSSAPEDYDVYVKIMKKEDAKATGVLPRRQTLRPTGSLELLQAMRLGLHPEGVRILRAKGELAYESTTLEIRLAYVYDAQSYRGMVYDVRNTSVERQSFDASRLRGRGTSLILSALRDNVILPKTTTRLYAVIWKD